MPSIEEIGRDVGIVMFPWQAPFIEAMLEAGREFDRVHAQLVETLNGVHLGQFDKLIASFLAMSRPTVAVPAKPCQRRRYQRRR